MYHRGMAIGSLIQAWRTSRRYSVEALAVKARITPETLGDIESDQLDPTVTTLESLAAALEIPPAWLFGDPKSVDLLFEDPEDSPSADRVDPVTERILLASRMDRSLFVHLTALIQSGEPKLLRAAEVSLRSLAKQSKQATVPWQSRPPGHFEPPND